MYRKNKTDWLSSLLQSKFFGPCSDHQELSKNEKNLLCIDCSLEFCRHCEAHNQHRSLRIFKYVYQDVVRVQDMQKHHDCSKIQVSYTHWSLIFIVVINSMLFLCHVAFVVLWMFAEPSKLLSLLFYYYIDFSIFPSTVSTYNYFSDCFDCLLLFSFDKL